MCSDYFLGRKVRGDSYGKIVRGKFLENEKSEMASREKLCFGQVPTGTNSLG